MAKLIRIRVVWGAIQLRKFDVCTIGVDACEQYRGSARATDSKYREMYNKSKTSQNQKRLCKTTGTRAIHVVTSREARVVQAPGQRIFSYSIK